MKLGFVGQALILLIIAISLTGCATESRRIPYPPRHHGLISAEENRPSIYPVKTTEPPLISSRFGMRSDPFTCEPKMHKGIDIAVPLNTPILAAANGIVTFSDWYNGYGNMIKLDHQNGFETMYGHLNSALTKKGQSVNRGDVIGYSGSTGKSTGPHLHYQIMKDEQPVNPEQYMPSCRIK